MCAISTQFCYHRFLEAERTSRSVPPKLGSHSQIDHNIGDTPQLVELACCNAADRVFWLDFLDPQNGSQQ